MKVANCFKITVWAFSCLGMLFGNHLAMAASPSEKAVAGALPTNVADVELAEGGVLTGRVISSRGLPQANIPVSIATEGGVVATVNSDALGVFRVSELRGGTYQVHVKGGVCTSRLWAAKTAPPHARPSLMVVSSDGVLAGQHAPLKAWLADPFVMAGIIALAVAIPVAIATSRDSGS